MVNRRSADLLHRRREFDAKQLEHALDSRLAECAQAPDVGSPDGQRFLMVKPAGEREPPTTAINVVLNWTEELKRRVPTK